MRKGNRKRIGTTREIVEDIFVEHPDWDAAKVFREYQRIQPEDHQVTHPSSIRKHLEAVKNQFRDLTEKGLDAPWSMASYAQMGFEVTQYQLSSEDNQAILRVRKMQTDRNDISKSMSIRQALWIARLRATMDQLGLDKTPEGKDYWVWRYSFEYAIREKVAKLKKPKEQTFNSRELDDALAQGHDKFKETYEKGVYANWKDYERFYTSHMVESEYKHLKDGAR